MISISEIKTKIASPYHSIRGLVVKATDDGSDAFDSSGLLSGKNPYWNIFSGRSPGNWVEFGNTLKMTLPPTTRLSDWVGYNHNAVAPYANFDKTITLTASGNGGLGFEIDLEEFDKTEYSGLFVEFTISNWTTVRSPTIPIAKLSYPVVELTSIPASVTSGMVTIWFVRGNVTWRIPFNTFDGVVSIQRQVSIKPKVYYVFETDEHIQNAWFTQPANNSIIEYSIGVTNLGTVYFSYQMGMGAEVTFCLYRNYSLEKSWELGGKNPGTTYSDGIYLSLNNPAEANDEFTFALLPNF